jgi:hypothetical protein
MTIEKIHEDIKEDLEPSAGDYAHAGVRAGLSIAPFLGAPLAEFFSMVIAPPLEKRRDAWLVEIFSRLKNLEERVDGFKLENLAENEVFISTLLYATQVAMRTHQEEKMTALRNAVINSAFRPSIDENLQLMFLNLVDRYTRWHLIILHFLDDPREYGKRHSISYASWSSGGTASVLEYAIPEMKGRRQFYDQIVKMLFSDGLLNSETFMHTTMTVEGMFASRTSEIGKRFLGFISQKTG